MENDLFKNPPRSPFAKGGDVKKDSGHAGMTKWLAICCIDNELASKCSWRGRHYFNECFQDKIYCGFLRVIRKDFHCLGDITYFALYIYRYSNLSRFSWFQAARTSHHSCTSSSGLQSLYDKFFIPIVFEIEGMLNFSSRL
jgi:hypothetical protein